MRALVVILALFTPFAFAQQDPEQTLRKLRRELEETRRELDHMTREREHQVESALLRHQAETDRFDQEAHSLRLRLEHEEGNAAERGARDALTRARIQAEIARLLLERGSTQAALEAQSRAVGAFVSLASDLQSATRTLRQQLRDLTSDGASAAGSLSRLRRDHKLDLAQQRQLLADEKRQHQAFRAEVEQRDYERRLARLRAESARPEELAQLQRGEIHRLKLRLNRLKGEHKDRLNVSQGDAQRELELARAELETTKDRLTVLRAKVEQAEKERKSRRQAGDSELAKLERELGELHGPEGLEGKVNAAKAFLGMRRTPLKEAVAGLAKRTKLPIDTERLQGDEVGFLIVADEIPLPQLLALICDNVYDAKLEPVRLRWKMVKGERVVIWRDE